MTGITQEQLLWRIIDKLNEAINSQHETIEFLMGKRLEQRNCVGIAEEDRDAMRVAMVFIMQIDKTGWILDTLQPEKEEVLSLLAERLEQSRLKEKNHEEKSHG